MLGGNAKTQQYRIQTGKPRNVSVLHSKYLSRTAMYLSPSSIHFVGVLAAVTLLN